MEMPMELIETRIIRQKRESLKKKDRRCGDDRRKTYCPEHFLKGGQERRSGRERRFVWYMTM